MKQQLVFTTDCHGFPLALGRVQAYLQQHPESIFIDNGDFFLGSQESLFETSQQNISRLTLLANQLNVQAIVVGNHDLDAGLDFLKRQKQVLKAPLLSCNLVDNQDELIFKPYTIVDINQQKIAIIGALTQNMAQLSTYQVTKDFKVLDPISCIQQQITTLQSKVDKIIVCYHGGLERDLVSGRWTQYDTKEDQTYEIACECPDIDLLICGHQHRFNQGVVGKVPILQLGYQGSHFGVYNGQQAPELIENKTESHCDVTDLTAYQAWLNQPFDLSDFKQFLRSRVVCDELFIKVKGDTIQDFLRDLQPKPFSLNLYELSQQECHLLKLESTKTEPIAVVSNCDLGFHRLKRAIMDPILIQYLIQK